ncbi:MAG TPA: DUF981 family protein [Thermoplasmata archaeon]|jgi:putative membrane protein|nr:DUF981 family protein [Thermoplasmata archaeon]
MSFLDDLTLIIDLLVLIAAVVFYTGFMVWLSYRRNDTDRAVSHLREGATLLGLLGGLAGIFGLWVELTWPLPGAYNIYFGDPIIMLAILLVAFGVTVSRKLPTHFVGMLGVVLGSGVIFYGSRAYLLNLTSDPFETFLLYLGYGAAAIMAYPATLFIDWFIVGPQLPSVQPLPSGPKPDNPRMWMVLLGLFLLIVVLAGVAAVIYGFTSVWAHLGSPP